MWTEQIIFKNMYSLMYTLTNTYMHCKTIGETRGHRLKESREGYMGAFSGGKRWDVVILL